MSLQEQLVGYLSAFTGQVPHLGSAAPKGKMKFADGLQAIFWRSRLGYWICLVVLVALVAAALVPVAIGQTVGVERQTVLGVSAAGSVVMLIRFMRDHSRTEVVLLAMQELRSIDEAKFADLVASLARRWYGLEFSVGRSQAAVPKQ